MQILLPKWVFYIITSTKEVNLSVLFVCVSVSKEKMIQKPHLKQKSP